MKKVLRSIAVSIVMCITVQSYIFSLNIKNDVKAESLIVTGDLNDDNCVDSTDLSILSLFLVGDMKLPLNTQILADVDRDETVSLADLAKYRQFLSKRISSLIELDIDTAKKEFQKSISESNGVGFVPSLSPFITTINLNSKTISIPRGYIYTNSKNYGEIHETTLDFSKSNYFVWVYFNTETKTYSIKNYFSFNKNEILLMLFPIQDREHINVSSVMAYKVISGYIGFIGDSITAGDGGTPYCNKVADSVGMDYFNYGHSGCSFTLDKGNTFKDYVSTYADDLDVVVIWGGVNDFLWFDNWNMFEAEFESFIKTIISKYPKSKILIMTPQKFYISGGKFASARVKAWDDVDSRGKTLKDYVDVEKAVASKYQIPVLDMFEVGVPVVQEEQRNLYFNGNGDWLHPNKEGYEFIANRISKAIESL